MLSQNENLSSVENINKDNMDIKNTKEETHVIRTLHFRLKNKHKAFLLKQAYEVNQVWNYVQNYSLELLKREGKFSCRKEFIHQLTTQMVKQYTALFLGNAKIQFMIDKNTKDKKKEIKKINLPSNKNEKENLNAKEIITTNNTNLNNINIEKIENKKSKFRSKSAHDAGWGMFTTILQYKSNDARRWFLEVNEAYSTQTCSHCLKKTGPKGEDELHVKQWTCSHCHTLHHRDVNAAINILKLGLILLEKLFNATSSKDFSSASAQNFGTDCSQSGIPCL